MFTIDRLAKLDAIAHGVFTTLREGIDWLGEKYEDFLVNAAYRVAEAKARVASKLGDNINALEDAYNALGKDFEEAKACLKAKYQLALGALEEELDAKDDALRADLAEAVQKLVAANRDYDATIKAASDKLGVEIEA